MLCFWIARGIYHEILSTFYYIGKMFLRAIRRFAVIACENSFVRRDLCFRNGLKNLQNMKYASNVFFPQNVAPDFTTDFSTVENSWNIYQKNAFDDFLFECFEKEKDSFSYAVYLMLQAAQNHKTKQNAVNLAHTIMNAFCHWKASNSVSQSLTAELQNEALVIALSFKDRYLTHLICTAFNISSKNDFVYDIIEECVTHKKFVEACICVVVLKMHRNFPLEKILVPLVIEGRMSHVKMYAADNRTLQVELVKLLDKTFQLLPSSEKTYGKTERDIYQRLNNLLTGYKIPIDICPNLCNIRNLNTMNFLMQQKYGEKPVARPCWEEMITASVHDSPLLQKSLIFKLVDVKDFPTALKVANKFQIPVNEWPSDLQNFKNDGEMSEFALKTDNSQGTSTVDGSCQEQADYLSLHLDSSCVKYVETVKQFEDCLNHISQNYDIVGIDSEWKPTRRRSSKNRMALLQLAVEDCVYLVDIFALSNRLEASHWDDLMEKLFGNPKITKLGCGLIADVDILIKTYQGTAWKPFKFLKLLDVSILFHQFQFAYPDIRPGCQNLSLLGLSRICSYVLGKPLRKQHQFSDWEERPLSGPQMTYAALDAYCLLQIYSKLKEIAEEKDLCFRKMLKTSFYLTAEPPKTTSYVMRKLTWLNFSDGFEVRSVIKAKDFKVLIDRKLEDLGKELKFFGVDVSFLEDSLSPCEAVEKAREEDRAIVASNLVYDQVKGLIPEELCHNVSEDIMGDQPIVPSIFKRFNVRVEASTINAPDLDESAPKEISS